MVVIKTNNLTKEYGNKVNKTKVIKNLSLRIASGEFVSILGPSGSGKSTLLYLLSGLEPYTSGSLELFSKELNQYSEPEMAVLRQTKIGFVFQDFNLIANLNVLENVLLANIIKGEHDELKAIEMLKMVKMSEYLNFYPNQISGGMKQRVAIARALVNDPQIIFADEPTGNLDYQNGLAIMEIFKSLNQDFNKTIILVTHNDELTKYGNRVIRLSDGVIINDEKS